MNEIETADSKIAALTYSNKFHGSTFLIKLGGSILHNEAMIASLCQDLKLLKNAGINIILVHGGSKAINHFLNINQIESEFKDGLRVTSLQAMTIIEMVLCGHVNKTLVRKLNAIGTNAMGLSGSDNNMLLCEPYSHEHGCVGTITKVNTMFLKLLCKKMQGFDGIMPVIAPVGIDKNGSPLNINADTAASQIAIALKVDKLIFLTDQNGIYDEQGKIYSELNKGQLLNLIRNETVQGGMLTKARSILTALNEGLNEIHILNGCIKNVLINELFTVEGIGTLCKNEQITQKKSHKPIEAML